MLSTDLNSTREELRAADVGLQGSLTSVNTTLTLRVWHFVIVVKWKLY